MSNRWASFRSVTVIISFAVTFAAPFTQSGSFWSRVASSEKYSFEKNATIVFFPSKGRSRLRLCPERRTEVVRTGPAAPSGGSLEDNPVGPPAVTRLGGESGKIAMMSFRNDAGGQPVGFIRG